MNQKKSDKPWFIYLIKNKLNQLYCGISVDVPRRFFEHVSNSPKCAKALKGKGPLVLMFCAQVGSQSDALKLERWLKKQTREFKDRLIAGTSKLPSSTLSASKLSTSKLSTSKLPIEHELLDTSLIQADVMLKAAYTLARKQSCNQQR